MNYLQELKHCGDTIYKKNQFWEFIPSGSKGTINEELINSLSNILNISLVNTIFV